MTVIASAVVHDGSMSTSTILVRNSRQTSQ